MNRVIPQVQSCSCLVGFTASDLIFAVSNHVNVWCRYNLKKLTYDERKNKLIERLNALNNAAGADDDDEEDD